jgi:hypothetical protein
VPRRLSIALSACLSFSALLYFAWSWHWPLVGDASLIHYIALLIERGWSPYRDLVDMNMPGSYLIEMAAMRVFGMGDLAWRLFDFALMAAASAAFFVIARRKTMGSGWLSALFAASLFILVHGRDGLAEGGQRDLTMAVCLLVATAFLFIAIRRDSLWAAFAFGLFSGVALTIKPPALPLTVAQLVLATITLRQRDRSQSHRRYIAAALAGYLVAPAIALVFLLRERALAAFFANIHGLVLYYEGLGHRSLGFLLLHSISPLLPLVLTWFAVLALRRPKLDWQRAQLLCGALFGLVSYVVQARGFPYYRYTLLGFLLPLMALDFSQALWEERDDRMRETFSTLRSTAARWLAIAALCFGGFVLAPQSALLLHRYRWWQTDFINSLQQNLDALGGQRLSGHIQCIDTISGCENVLYRMRLEPADGLLVDFPLFGADDVVFVQQTRQRFSTAMSAAPPQVLVVSSALYVDGPGDYRKLDRWPAFQSVLAANYTLHTEWTPTRTARWWSREETPASYRIYLLRSRP